MRTILFAHDMQENPEGRRNFLELAGYSVQTLANYTALEAALNQPGVEPSLLLVDVLLEGKHGFEVAKTISQNTPDRAFPIVLCSRVYRTRPFRDEALKCGAQDYLLLPMPPDEFLRRVNQAIAYYVPPGSNAAAA